MTPGYALLCHRSTRFLAGSAILLFAILAGCGEPGGRETPLEPQFARGGGGPPVKVNSTDPTVSVRDTTLDVRVLGSNFEPGSTVEFLFGGAAVTKVRTNSTTFVSDSELRANITIDVDADLGLYDVEVQTPRKKGIGTELFEVQDNNGNGPLPDPIPLIVAFDDSYAGVQSDGLGDYVDGVDLVNAILRSNGNLNYDSGLGGPPLYRTDRLNRIHLTEPTPTGDTIVLDGFYHTLINTNNRQAGDAVLGQMAPATDGYTVMAIHVFVDDHEYIVRYGRDCDANAVPAARAYVTHPDESRWILTGSGGVLCEWLGGGQAVESQIKPYVDAPISVTLIRR